MLISLTDCLLYVSIISRNLKYNIILYLRIRVGLKDCEDTYIKVVVKQAKGGYSLFSSVVTVLEGFWDSDEDKGGASAAVSVAS